MSRSFFSPHTGINVLLQGAAGGPPVFQATFSYIDGGEQSATTATQTLTLGPEASDRIIVFGFGGSLSAGSTISSITLTPDVGPPVTVNRPVQSVSGTRNIEIGYALIPVGSTATIVLTSSSGNITRYGLGYWILRNSTQTSPTTVSGSAPTSSSSATSIVIPSTGTVTVPTGGLVFGVGYQTANDPINVSSTLQGSVTPIASDTPGVATSIAFWQTNTSGAESVTISNSAAVATNIRGAFITWSP